MTEFKTPPLQSDMVHCLVSIHTRVCVCVCLCLCVCVCVCVCVSVCVALFLKMNNVLPSAHTQAGLSQSKNEMNHNHRSKIWTKKTNYQNVHQHETAVFCVDMSERVHITMSDCVGILGSLLHLKVLSV